MNNSEWLEIGTIVAPQGLNGEMRVYPTSDFPERFEEPGTRWLLKPGETEPQPIELLGGYYLAGKNLYVVELAGIENRSQVEELRGYQLMVQQSDRPTLAEDEYHIIDLVGAEVFNQLTGENLGVVISVISAGNDLLEVKPHPISSPHQGKQKPAKNILIPFVKEIVPVVDIVQKRIEINPPPGLLTINN
ncbi:MAG: ribosome maturation factor RimM [Crinalium sp.]